MTFWKAFAASYTRSFAFLIACPLLALVPVALELAQHWGEVHIGMYDSVAQAKALEHHPLRMGLGMVKVASLMMTSYWVTRYLATGDAKWAARMGATEARLFGLFLMFELCNAAVQLFLLPQTATAQLVSFGLGSILTVLIMAWGAAAALGNAAIGPIVSAQIMGRQFWWALGFSLIVMLPLMIPHYALGGLALLGPKPLLWPVLIVDSLLVSWLAAMLSAAAWFSASRAAERGGVSLLPATD